MAVTEREVHRAISGWTGEENQNKLC